MSRSLSRFAMARTRDHAAGGGGGSDAARAAETLMLNGITRANVGIVEAGLRTQAA